MRFALWRRVQAMTYDEIDEEIDKHQEHAEQLVSELQQVLAEQNELWRELKGKVADGE